MSGFGERDGRVVWNVLDSQVWRWHGRRCECPDTCNCWDGVETCLRSHLEPAGFVIGTHYSGRKRVPYFHVEGPGIAQHSTDELYEALTNQPGRFGSQRP